MCVEWTMKSINVFLDELRNELSSIGAGLQVTEKGFVIGGGVIYENSRFAQISPALEERGKALFEVCFQQSRFVMARAQTDVPSSLAQALQVWIKRKVGVTQMAKGFPFITVQAGVEPTQEDLRRFVETHWLEFAPYVFFELNPFFEAAKEHPILRQLYWATSHRAFHFSRSPGLPWLNDCPGVERICPVRSFSVALRNISPAERQRIREIPLREAGLELEFGKGGFKLSRNGRVISIGDMQEISQLIDQHTRLYYLVFDGGGNFLDAVADVTTAVDLVVKALPPGCVQDGVVRYL
ncbi:hypothetical protein U27_05628 [Candidatus Vecturithrix granuli]|uniref:Uncharacterized protein n=1 Tax=Vecturithrix granuli TaxID=1499967 RepID=A0A081C249_VECG1|nr:hypothetical protein U27_05628 [Candidatus Vecturithrix granuli]